jgi:putative transposase
VVADFAGDGQGLHIGLGADPNVPSAEAWPWGSLRTRLRGSPQRRAMLTDSSVALPPDWPAIVNHPPDPAELTTLRHSLPRSVPLGGQRWTAGVVRALGLEATQRPPGRPRKPKSVGLQAENAT